MTTIRQITCAHCGAKISYYHDGQKRLRTTKHHCPKRLRLELDLEPDQLAPHSFLTAAHLDALHALVSSRLDDLHERLERDVETDEQEAMLREIAPLLLALITQPGVLAPLSPDDLRRIHESLMDTTTRIHSSELAEEERDRCLAPIHELRERIADWRFAPRRVEKRSAADVYIHPRLAGFLETDAKAAPTFMEME